MRGVAVWPSVLLAAAALAVTACASTPPTTDAPSAAAVTSPGSSATPSSQTPPATPNQPLPSSSPSGAPSLPPTLAPPPTFPPPDDLAAGLVKPGALTVCLAVVGPPAAALRSNGDVDGYNVAFARELARRLGLKASFRVAIFGDLKARISAHDCDVSISSQNITDMRRSEMDLIAYTRSKQPVLVAAGNPAAIATLADLCAKPVSATAGSTHVDLVNGSGDFVGRGLNDQCAAAGEQPIDLQTFPTDSEAVQALLSGQVDAYLGNPNYVYDYPDRLEYSTAQLPPAEQGIGVALDRPAISGAIGAALDEMMGDGTYAAILREYLPDDQSVRDVSIAE